MHFGVLKVGAVALGLTLARDVGAQTRTTGGRQVLTAPASTKMMTIPRLPSVIGLPADSASKVLSNVGVAVVRSEVNTSAAPRDQVIDQQPGAGTPLSAVREVMVVIAIPPATQRISGAIIAGMTGGVIVPPKRVVRVRPAGPPPSAAVPQLLGRNARSAAIVVSEVGLRLDPQVVSDFSDAATAGFVFHQEPQPMVRVDTGSLVKIWVSLGPHPAPTTITTPDVVGRSLPIADRVLRGAQLVVGHVDTVFRAGGRGQIEHQLPEAGASVHPTDAVALTIAIAPPLVPVPSVLGLRPAEARLILRRAGLALGQITPVTVSGRDTVIVGQRPSAYTSVDRGTFVDVEENHPAVRRRILVPDLAGMTSAEATQRLMRDSLTRGDVVVSDNGDAPVVVAQRPLANEPAYFYDAVSFTVASPRPVRPAPTIVATPPVTPPSTPQQRVAPPLTTAPPIQAPAGITTSIAKPATEDTVRLVRVPHVTNMPFEGARQLIDRLGLVTVSTAPTTGRSFVVRTQRPDSGSLVRVGAQVALVLEPLDVRPVPRLVGLRRSAAEDHANDDGFTLVIRRQHRVLLQLFDEVSTQEPEGETIARGDESIRVDLSTPLFPPIPAAIVLVVAAAGTAAKMRPRRPPAENSLPVGDLDFALETVIAPAVPSPIPNDRVIRTAITFALDPSHGEWTVASEEKSLVSHIKTHV